MPPQTQESSLQHRETAPLHIDPRTRRYTLPELWHLLSLDAPTVAVAWFILAARAAHLHLLRSDSTSLFLATWIFYAVDRLLDAHYSEPFPEERHHFHGQYSKAFLIALICAAPVLLLLLQHMEPTLRRFWLLLGLGAAGYYAWIHTRPSATDSQLPKELSVGIGFTVAVFLPEALYGVNTHLLPHATCFGALCWLNCTLIYEREHTDLRNAHWSTRFAIRHAALLQASVLLTGLVLCFIANASIALPLCIALSAAIMMALRRSRHRMHRLTYRIAADAAMLTPTIFLFR